MAIVMETETAFVVRDRAGRLVLAFWGAEAPAEVQTWTDRGYVVEPVERALVAA